ncbi:flagellar export chaperone FlgN [Oceanisphaera pacifica]|uniref:Flagellar protein FlgN n=1 Tax=Oceanisphaera pacifica TaxID=2818389 RepID=A0ABS3NHA1_9GAMM|nr:flagellar export chaperone FlgN [Oceanisphaera pacifica]MBO1519973.1 flagellar protein FlgN [Oceanisphaera pacifica]
MSLAALLDTQQSQLKQLLDITQQELELITQRKALALPPLAESKQALLTLIQKTDSELAHHPDKARLADEFKDQVSLLRDLVTECQERSQVAEQLLEQSLNGIRQLSNILSKLHERQSMTYDQKGHTKGINKGAGFKV